jgi:hypothetical protein
MNKKYDNNNIIIASRAYFLQIFIQVIELDKKHNRKQNSLLVKKEKQMRILGKKMPQIMTFFMLQLTERLMIITKFRT